MQNDNISRHQFLRKLGLGGAALMAVYCAGTGLSSCTNEPIGPSNTSFTIDLNDAANSALAKSGGYIIKNSVVIANTGNGYVAVTQICSHEGQRQIIFQNGEFYCTAHGARYNTSGKGLNANGNRGLTVYPISVSGNILTIG